MSTTQASAQTVRELEVDPAEVFATYVEADPLTCNGCFSRPVPEQTDGTNVHARGTHGAVTVEDGEGGLLVEPRSEHTALYDWEAWDACPNCGRLGMPSPEATLSIEAARERAIECSRRLYERGIAHRPKRLTYFVGLAKRRETLAGRDRDIVARAVEFAIRPYR